MVRQSATVVLVHAAGAGMRDARRRAEAMARMLGARLVVARLDAGAPPRLSMLFPGAWIDDGTAALNRALRDLRALSRWLAARERAGREPISAHLSSSLQHLREICSDPTVELVVMPGSLAARATWLARRVRAPVLLARRTGSDRTALLAATDLANPERPVLRFAGALAERLRTTLTVMHNLPGFAAQLVAAGLSATMPALPDDAAVAAEQERELRREVTGLGLAAEVAVTRRLDAATGILEAAVAANTDLIVVGAHRPRFFAEHVCERVCTLSDRSVLLVPT